MKAVLPGTDKLIKRALAEDHGSAGDLTSTAVVATDQHATGEIVVREACRIAGLRAALRAFLIHDPSLTTTELFEDGDDAGEGVTVATVAGDARSILGAERVSLNLLGQLCGVATATARLVALVEGTRARIVDTRKTTPGMRALQKAAVRSGGGANHRFGLYDAVLIKDNHIVAAGSIEAAVERAREAVGHTLTIEVEADTLAQVSAAADLGVDVVLLDNMTPETLRRAVVLVAGRCKTEASGGITEDTVRSVAESGVDVISVGAITHSAAAIDVGLDLRLD